MYRYDREFVHLETEYVCASLRSIIDIIHELPDVHYIAGIRAQLYPKAWLNILTSGSGYDPDIRYILEGITFGFKVIDHSSLIEPYCCKNYRSCFSDSNLSKLNSLIESEVRSGKLSLVSQKPRCIHSLGVISKKDSCKIRPITDCSQPEGASVNSYMELVQNRFRYVTVEQVVSHMMEGNLFIYEYRGFGQRLQVGDD